MKTTPREVYNFMRPIILMAALLVFIGLVLLGCQTAEPTLAPAVYNITDNSVTIVGDNNTPSIAPTTTVTSDVAARADTNQAKSDKSLLWAIIAFIIIAVAGVLVWLKFIKKEVQLRVV